jgi:hypothetical protein
MNAPSPEVSFTGAVTVAMAVPADGTELRVVLYDGYLKFKRVGPDYRHEGFRTFSFAKLAPYSTLISESYREHGEDHDVAIPLHITETFRNPYWRTIFFWELELKGCCKPALDEPFRELLTLLEKTNDALGASNVGLDTLTLPQIDGITKDVSTLRLARLYWAAKHLRFQAPLPWEKDLRTALMNQINSIDTLTEKPAFRGVDFWFIWGAYRGLDDKVVDAMVAKYVDAIDHGTQPKELQHEIMDGAELKEWMGKLKQKKSSMSWAEKIGGAGGGMSGRRSTTPSLLNLASSRGKSCGAKTAPGPTTVNGSETRVNDEQKTATSAPITILKNDIDHNGDAGDDHDKKNKGEGYTAPTGMAPPPITGSMRGKKKGMASKRWRGSH